MKRKEAFADVLNLILGAWLFLSPWIAGFSGAGVPARNAWILGVVVAIVAIAALAAFAEWEEWINLVLGLWVLGSPWVLGFAANAVAMWVHVLTGLAVAVVAAVELWMIHN